MSHSLVSYCYTECVFMHRQLHEKVSRAGKFSQASKPECTSNESTPAVDGVLEFFSNPPSKFNKGQANDVEGDFFFLYMLFEVFG